ncbi:acyl-CoA thioester hydrolase [Tamaricihabitans halophyticus]|uniref:Acyl-CoA thioester hydrolase n=1 Tax=Tamaricihabitans halophyticus TaxID=1262583 RepID=A0A4R2QU31_9PSEU|nr:thioesterase family protein [Tamaricihabitans halophyticus]TCP53460.1 acyl-CoA thioester hydrolase [Tamaricihabitans halophyticus]
MKLARFHQQVRPEWIDYNGHLSEAYYVLVFGFATDAVMDQVGLDAKYRTSSGCSLYTVEAHIRYLHEVDASAQLTVISRIVGVGRRKLRLCHEMAVADVVVATEEILAVHVDGQLGASAPFPTEIARSLDALVEPAPEFAGRSIA